MQEKVLIAHSRDENYTRGKAIVPGRYLVNGYALIFPRDSTAGGTWIACRDNGTAAVLLNGAGKKHLYNPPYRQSRGLVFLDVLATADPYLSYQQLKLDGIEPFTLILWSQQQQLFECCWDGAEKHIVQLAADKPHTWSSVTLYDEATRAVRKKWFTAWVDSNPYPSINELVDFHLTGGDGNPHNDLLMNRNNTVLTVSITALEILEDRSVMQYMDIPSRESSVCELIFTKAAAIL